MEKTLECPNTDSLAADLENGSSILQALKKQEQSDGWAPIKAEYLLPPPNAASPSLPVEQTPKLGMKRPRGQNQERGGNRRLHEDTIKLCVEVARGKPCPRPPGECRHSHDVEAYLATRPADIPHLPCPSLALGIECRFGLTCRLASTHKAVGADSSTKLGHGVLSQVRQAVRKVQAFPLSDGYLERMAASAGSGGQGGWEDWRTLWPDQNNDDQQGSKPLAWQGKTYLAPLTTVGNLPFRRICREWGVDITCGEMALADKLLEGRAGEWALLKRHAGSEASDFGVQLAGASPLQLTRVAELIQEQRREGLLSLDFVDLNMGCPIDLLFERGMGSGLLSRPKRIGEILSGMTGILRHHDPLPLTVKVRIGIDDGKPLAHRLLPQVAGWGAQAFTIHGRTRQQRYTREADWSYIEQCVQAADGHEILVNGNGDVMGWEQVAAWQQQARREQAEGVAVRGAIMVGRGALIKPWLFTEAREQRHWDISAGERLEMLQRFCRHGLEHWGSDGEGVEKTRRFLLEWMSFLHRYIPVGLLERLPQRLNERPRRFCGRSDLETLLASESVEDWLEVARRALGCREPEGFSFVPKHKSNSYAPSVMAAAGSGSKVVQEYQG